MSSFLKLDKFSQNESQDRQCHLARTASIVLLTQLAYRQYHTVIIRGIQEREKKSTMYIGHYRTQWLPQIKVFHSIDKVRGAHP